MGKNCDFSKQRKCLMKTLKKLTEKLENSSPCQVKSCSCNPCCPIGTYSYGPPKCQCLLVPNCFSNSSYFASKCGPFPECSTCSLPSKRYCQVPQCISKFSTPCPACQSRNEVKCCKPFKCYCTPKLCTCTCCCNQSCIPCCCICPKRCCLPSGRPKCRCFTSFCCKNQPSPQISLNYTPKKKYKSALVGKFCCGCNTVCIPRLNSDTALVVRKRGKPLTCSKSVELRGGKLYRGCDCDKKNGLQDRCLRYCCINNPKCRTVPASCHCNKYSCGKHLSIRYGKNKSISYTCYICGPSRCPCMSCCPIICCDKRTRYCQTQCDIGSQFSPTTCEVECCCQPYPVPCLLGPESNSPSPESCLPYPEPCCNTKPCQEPHISCMETGVPCIEPCCVPCENCDCAIQTVCKNCYPEYCSSHYKPCQSHQ